MKWTTCSRYLLQSVYHRSSLPLVSNQLGGVTGPGAGCWSLVCAGSGSQNVCKLSGCADTRIATTTSQHNLDNWHAHCSSLEAGVSASTSVTGVQTPPTCHPSCSLQIFLRQLKYFSLVSRYVDGAGSSSPMLGWLRVHLQGAHAGELALALVPGRNQ